MQVALCVRDPKIVATAITGDNESYVNQVSSAFNWTYTQQLSEDLVLGGQVRFSLPPESQNTVYHMATTVQPWNTIPLLQKQVL